MCINMLVEEFLQILYSTCLVLGTINRPNQIVAVQAPNLAEGFEEDPNHGIDLSLLQ